VSTLSFTLLFHNFHFFSNFCNETICVEERRNEFRLECNNIRSDLDFASRRKTILFILHLRIQQYCNKNVNYFDKNNKN